MFQVNSETLTAALERAYEKATKEANVDSEKFFKEKSRDSLTKFTLILTKILREFSEKGTKNENNYREPVASDGKAEG